MKTKYMNTSIGFVFGLKEVLDELVKNEEYQAQIGNITIIGEGTIDDKVKGKIQVFRIIRKVED